MQTFHLNPREATIVAGLLAGNSMQEIADKFGVSRTRIHQIAKKAKSKGALPDDYKTTQYELLVERWEKVTY